MCGVLGKIKFFFCAADRREFLVLHRTSPICPAQSRPVALLRPDSPLYLAVSKIHIVMRIATGPAGHLAVPQPGDSYCVRV
jgi:hypothetical protein